MYQWWKKGNLNLIALSRKLATVENSIKVVIGSLVMMLSPCHFYFILLFVCFVLCSCLVLTWVLLMLVKKGNTL